MYSGEEMAFYHRKRSYIEESLAYPFDTKRIKTEPIDPGYDACNGDVTMTTCNDMYFPEQYRPLDTPLDYRIPPPKPYYKYQKNVLKLNNLYSPDYRITSDIVNKRMGDIDLSSLNDADLLDLGDSEVFTINASDLLDLSAAVHNVVDATQERPGRKPSSRKRSDGSRSSKAATQYTTVPLPPCKVCGGVATGFHFGVITCEACKAFFRRALIHKQNYKCLKDDDCDIIDKKLGNCSACRLKKCFALGMSKGGVRRGRYSIAIRTKAIIEAKALEGKEASVVSSQSVKYESDGNVSPDSGISLESLDDIFDIPDLSPKFHKKPGFVRNDELEYLIDTLMSCQEALYPQLRKLVDDGLEEAQYKIYEEFSLKEEAFGEVFGKTDTISTEEYQQIFAETGIDLDDRLLNFNRKGKSMEENIAQYVNFAKVIPGFKHLHPKDVSKLLKAAHMEFWIFGSFRALNKELGVCGGAEGMIPCHRNQMKIFFGESWVNTTLDFADTLKQLNITLEEISIIRVILLSYTDRCELLEREKIQNLQEKFVECLQYHLQKTCENPGKRLAQLFDRMLAVRDLTQLNIHVNEKFLQEWGFVMHDYPLWKEMVSWNEI